MLWVDSNDPCVIASVVLGRQLRADEPNLVISPDQLSDIEQALAIAGDVLMRLSGYLLHPAGQATEEYIAVPSVHRLTPTFRPIREILSMGLRDGITSATFPWSACVIGQSVYFNKQHCDIRYVMDVCGCVPRNEVKVSMTYTFGSTLTPAAIRALELFARQLYLALIGSSECELPERVTSVSREGLTYTIIDPQTFLSQGFTGLSRVDMFLAAFNANKARRPSAVYTPDSPPGVPTSVRMEFQPVVNPL